MIVLGFVVILCFLIGAVVVGIGLFALACELVNRIKYHIQVRRARKDAVSRLLEAAEDMRRAA